MFKLCCSCCFMYYYASSSVEVDWLEVALMFIAVIES